MTRTGVMMSSGTNQNKTAIKKYRGEVFLDASRCMGCGFCVEFCPTQVLVMDKGYNPKGYHSPRVMKPDACTGCDLCGLYCPDFAIYAIRIPSNSSDLQEKKHEGKS